MPDSKGQEFYYVDRDGKRQDRDMHAVILGQVKTAPPMNQSIMQPIRERNRARYRAEQRAADRKKRWQRAKADAQKLLSKSADWDESEHPRDEGGKFTFSGGGGEPGTHATSPSQHAKDETSASSLLKVERGVTVDEVVARVPGGTKAVADARANLKTGVATNKLVSEGGYKLPNGQWTPERVAIQNDIIAKNLTPEKVAAATPKPGEQPVLHILGGRGGSGKGWFTKEPGHIDLNTSLYLNSDDFKEAFPEWKGWNAGQLHEESGVVGESLEKAAREAGLNVTIDTTLGDTAVSKQRIAEFKKAGYKIVGHYMYAAPDTAARRAVQRLIDGNKENGRGRFVPPEYSIGSVMNEHNFDTARKDMDSWEIYDNNVDGRAPQFHSRGGK